MSIDQYDLADLAKDLFHLYGELNRLKVDKAQAPRGERVMRPTPGPQVPGNSWAIHLEVDLAGRLFEMTRDSLNYTSRRTLVLTKDGHRCCAVIRTNAMEIVENFPAVDDLVELMRDQVRELKCKLRPAGVGQVAKRPEPRHPAGVIIGKLNNMGHKVSRDQLRQWSRRGHITSQLTKDRRAAYLMTEVIDYLEDR